MLTSTGAATRYRAFANVTSLVAGNDTYTVANVQTGRGDDRFAGWSLVVAYQDASQAMHRVSVYDGLGTVDATHTFSTNIAPFYTPASGAVVTKTGLLAFEGDAGLQTEVATFNGTALTDSLEHAEQPRELVDDRRRRLHERPQPLVQQHAGHGHRRLQQHRAAGQPPELGDAGVLLDPGPVRPVRAVARLRRGPGVQHERPEHRRHRPRRLDADRQPRQLGRHADDHLRVPVAALRRLRQQLRDIPGATGGTYTLGPDDVGSTIRVVVTAVNGAGSSTRRPRPPPARSASSRRATSRVPAVSGVTQDDQTLTTTLGGWSGTGPLDYDVQWQRCDASGNNCADIAGATAWSYVLTGADIGSTIRSEVTASNAAGSATAHSVPTGTVDPVAPVNTAAPALSGVARDGQTLSASTGTWTGTDPIAYTYQWQRCDAGGGNCADIAGETGSSYDLAAADIGHSVRVQVTGTNVAGHATASSSPTTAVIPDPPANTVAPALSGTAQDGSTLTLERRHLERHRPARLRHRVAALRRRRRQLRRIAARPARPTR